MIERGTRRAAGGTFGAKGVRRVVVAGKAARGNL
jgi:hypothetical protein